MRNRVAKLVAGVLAFSAMADVPRVMTFQGKLADTQGHYIEGQRALTFRVYDRETGGAVLWQEQHANTTVTKGIFAVPLGVYQPLNLAFDTNYWVSVEVGSDGEMSPRQRLTASAYAFRSVESEHARTADLAISAVNASNAVHAVLADSATSVANGGLPVGTILPYGGVNVPSGFLKCDGQALSSLSYPTLYAALGTAWGTGDGTLDGQGRAKDFRVPDLRGRFLRGVDEGVGRDPDRTARTAANTGGNAGDNVGSVQTNALGRHHHDFLGSYSSSPEASWRGVGPDGGHVVVSDMPDSESIVYTTPGDNWYHTNYVTWDIRKVQVYLQGTDRLTLLGNNAIYFSPESGGNESRPINANVFYIIKY